MFCSYPWSHLVLNWFYSLVVIASSVYKMLISIACAAFIRNKNIIHCTNTVFIHWIMHWTHSFVMNEHILSCNLFAQVLLHSFYQFGILHFCLFKGNSNRVISKALNSFTFQFLIEALVSVDTFFFLRYFAKCSIYKWRISLFNLMHFKKIILHLLVVLNENKPFSSFTQWISCCLWNIKSTQ